MKKRWGLFFLLLLCAASARAIHLEQDPDYSLYDNILQSYVSADGLVDYQGLRANSQKDLHSGPGRVRQSRHGGHGRHGETGVLD